MFIEMSKDAKASVQIITKSKRDIPSKVLSNDPIKLFLSDAPCNWSHAMNCGHAASACSKVFRKQVRPKLCKPAICPRLWRSLEAPVNNIVKRTMKIDYSMWEIDKFFPFCKPEGPQNTNAAVPSTAAVTPAAIKIFSPSMSHDFYTKIYIQTPMAFNFTSSVHNRNVLNAIKLGFLLLLFALFTFLRFSQYFLYYFFPLSTRMWCVSLTRAHYAQYTWKHRQLKRQNKAMGAFNAIERWMGFETFHVFYRYIPFIKFMKKIIIQG